MQSVIIQNLVVVFSSHLQTERAASEQALYQLATQTEFMPSLSNIILNHENNQLKLSAIIFLKGILSTPPTNPKQVISSLISILKHPLQLKLKKMIGDIIQTVLEKSNDGQKGNEIRGVLVNQVITEIRAISLNLGGMDLEEVGYNLVLVQNLTRQYNQISRGLIDGVGENILSIGLYLLKHSQPTEGILIIMKLITECFEQIFAIRELESNTPFQTLCVSAKFEEFIYCVLKCLAPNCWLILNKNNTYTGFEELVNETKSNALYLLSRSIYYTSKLHFNSTSLIKISTYLSQGFTTLKQVILGGVHSKYFKYPTLLKGTNEILKLLLSLVQFSQFYEFYSNCRGQYIQIISRIIQLTNQQKDLLLDSPQQLLILITQIMKAGSQYQIPDFFSKQTSQLPMRVLSARLLLQLLKYIDGVLKSLYEQTCENVLHHHIFIDDILLKQKCILLLGIICNCIEYNQEIKEKVDGYIEYEIDALYEVFQSTQNHKVLVIMKMVFITMYHHIMFAINVEERYCERLFELIKSIFQGDFQPAVQNPPILIASYDLLKSLLELNTHYSTQYTKSLLTYFTNTLSTQKPSINLLQSLGQLCNHNQTLQTLPQDLLSCLKNLITHIHKEMAQPNIDPNFINEILDIISLISNTQPLTKVQEWKAFFEENLFSLIEYFNKPIFIEEKVMRIVVKMIRTHKSINIQELKLITHAMEFVKSNQRFGYFYDLISLSMVYGERYYGEFIELSSNVAELCLGGLGIENILPAEMLKAIIMLSQLLDISRRLGTAKHEFLKVVFDSLMILYQRKETEPLIKYNILGVFSQILCCEFNQELFQIVVREQRIKIRSVFACKMVGIAFCELMVKTQSDIPEMFSIVISLMVYICSHEAKIFPLGESDDQEDYQLQKDLIIQNILDTRWLDVFQHTYTQIKQNPQLYQNVYNHLNQFQRVELDKLRKLKITKYGIREIRKLK